MEEATRDAYIGREGELDVKKDSTDTEYEIIQLSTDNAWRRTTASTPNLTSTINQQMHLYNFQLKHFKTLKTTPTFFDLFRSSSGSFVVPC